MLLKDLLDMYRRPYAPDEEFIEVTMIYKYKGDTETNYFNSLLADLYNVGELKESDYYYFPVYTYSGGMEEFTDIESGEIEYKFTLYVYVFNPTMNRAEDFEREED